MDVAEAAEAAPLLPTPPPPPLEGAPTREEEPFRTIAAEDDEAFFSYLI